MSMYRCSTPAHCSGLPTMQMPAPGRALVRPVHRFGSDQIAHGTGQLLYALIGNRLSVVCPDVLRALGRYVANQAFGRLPSILLVLAAYDLQSHAEAQILLTTVVGRHLPQHLHVGHDLIGRVTPEQMHV